MKTILFYQNFDGRNGGRSVAHKSFGCVKMPNTLEFHLEKANRIIIHGEETMDPWS